MKSKSAYWIATGHEEEYYGMIYQCSECGGETIEADNFCPFCGTSMNASEEMRQKVLNAINEDKLEG